MTYETALAPFNFPHPLVQINL